MASLSISAINTQYGFGYEWTNTTTRNTQDGDNARFYCGASGGSNFRPRIYFTVPTTIPVNNITKIYVRVKPDSTATYKYMRAYLSKTNVNSNASNILGIASTAKEMSYFYTSSSKATRVSTSGTTEDNTYAVFTGNLIKQSGVFYVYILPFSSDSATSETFSGSWLRSRNYDTYLEVVVEYYNSYEVKYTSTATASNLPAAQTKIHDTTLKLSTTVPTRQSSSSSSTFTITGNVNGGSGSNSSVTATKTTTTSYTFSNWTSSSDSTNYAAGANYTKNAATTMSANWTSSTSNAYSNNTLAGLAKPSKASTTAATYTVTFNYNGSGESNTTASSTKTTTYTFSHWSSTSSGGTTYTDSSSFTSATTVYAQYTSSTGNATPITLPSATRSNYTFLGWATSSSATTATYGAGTQYTPSANTTLYAVWKKQDTSLQTVVKVGSTNINRIYIGSTPAVMYITS